MINKTQQTNKELLVSNWI